VLRRIKKKPAAPLDGEPGAAAGAAADGAGGNEEGSDVEGPRTKEDDDFIASDDDDRVSSNCSILYNYILYTCNDYTVLQ
jgi:hypothetical protein